jgi:hypothetical protein
MKFTLSFIIAILFFTPSFAVAQDSKLIVCNKDYNSQTGKFEDPCNFNDVMELINNFFDFIVVLSIAISTVSFAVAGFKLLTSGGKSSARDDAKAIFSKTIIGFVIVLSAWLIVNTITSALLHTEFPINLLGN